MNSNNSSTNQSGYSFVEILVTVTLLGIVMVGFSRLFLASLVGGKKAKNLEEIKQNGNYVLTVMADMIRNAQSVESCAGDTSSLTIINQDDGTTIFSCLNQDAPDPDQIASNAANLINNEKIEVEDCSSIFNCQMGDGKPDMVKINFTLSRGESTDVKEYVSQSFRTTVSLRSY